MKKVKIKIDSNRIKVRGSWGKIRPVTKVVPSKKRYRRKGKHREDGV